MLEEKVLQMPMPVTQDGVMSTCACSADVAATVLQKLVDAGKLVRRVCPKGRVLYTSH